MREPQKDHFLSLSTEEISSHFLLQIFGFTLVFFESFKQREREDTPPPTRIVCYFLREHWICKGTETTSIKLSLHRSKRVSLGKGQPPASPEHGSVLLRAGMCSLCSLCLWLARLHNWKSQYSVCSSKVVSIPRSSARLSLGPLWK